MQHRVIEQRQHVENRDEPDRVGARMKKKSVSSSGVQVFTHLRPTFGSTMPSRTNSTMLSSAFMKPEGTRRSWRR